jgi:hypothetical protein
MAGVRILVRGSDVGDKSLRRLVNLVMSVPGITDKYRLTWTSL